jgi:hypothetical protein
MGCSAPDAMSRPTSDLLDPQVLGPRTNGYAIISGLNAGIYDCNAYRFFNVYTVCVWTVGSSSGSESLSMHVGAAVDDEVKELAIDRGDALQHNILRVVEDERLDQENKMRQDVSR